jgi:hypothetical protein
VEPLPDKWIYKKALEWLVDTMIVMQGSGECPFKNVKGTAENDGGLQADIAPVYHQARMRWIPLQGYENPHCRRR